MKARNYASTLAAAVCLLVCSGPASAQLVSLKTAQQAATPPPTTQEAATPPPTTFSAQRKVELLERRSKVHVGRALTLAIGGVHVLLVGVWLTAAGATLDEERAGVEGGNAGPVLLATGALTALGGAAMTVVGFKRFAARKRERARIDEELRALAAQPTSRFQPRLLLDRERVGVALTLRFP